MRLKRLSVQNFRTHNNYVVDFSHSTTLIIGPNGCGKTSLLEAVYIALRGVSFKGVDNEIRRDGEQWYRIDLETDANSRTVKHQADGVKKQFEVDGKKHQRLIDKAKYPVVLFEPDDLRLVSGSPSRRRDYIDTVLSQCHPHYSHTLHRYERALLQRNKLLKQPRLTADELFAWNIALSRYGAEIVEARQNVTHYINERIEKTYQTIAPIHDTIMVEYSDPHPISPQRILKDLEQSFEKDRAIGATTTGPHRHDLYISLNNHIAEQNGSRGELRTIALALKFIEAEYIMSTLGVTPIILLDDVFSELDDERKKRLMSEFQHYQVIMTSVDGAHMPNVRTISIKT